MSRSLVLLIASAVASAVACGSSTDASPPTLDGTFSLDSVDHRLLPTLTTDLGSVRYYAKSISVTIYSALGKYHAVEVDSVADDGFAPRTETQGADGFYSPAPGDANDIGPDSLMLFGFYGESGRMSIPNAFTLSSTHGVMYFSKH